MLGALRADEPGAAEVGLGKRVELLDRRLVPRYEWIDARIRDHVVKASTACCDLLHHAHDLRRIAHVSDDGKTFTAHPFDALEGLCRIVRQALVDPHHS